jgi:hypothetical protein
VVASVGSATDRPTLAVDFLRDFSVKSDTNDTSVLPSALAETSDGDYVVAGEFFHASGPRSTAWMARVRKDGVRLWDKVFPADTNSAIHGLAPSLDGAVLAVGSRSTAFAGPLETAERYIVAVDRHGRTTSERIIRLATVTHAIDAVAVGDSTVLIAGRLRQGSADSAFLAQVDRTGLPRWTKVFDQRHATRVRKLKSGGFVVGGRCTVPKSPVHGWVARTSKAGELLWDRCIADVHDVVGIAELGTGAIVAASQGGVRDPHTVSVRQFDAQGASGQPQASSLLGLCGLANIWADNVGLNLAGGCATHSSRLWLTRLDSTPAVLRQPPFDMTRVRDVSRVIPSGGGALIAVGRALTPSGASSDTWWILKARIEP